MTEKSAAAVARLESCKANLDSDYPTCVRCGLAWRRTDVAPACKPMSFQDLRQALLGEAAALEGSHHLIVGMGNMKVDPVDSLQRATALRCVLIVIERCGESKIIKAELQRLVRVADREAEGDQPDDE